VAPFCQRQELRRQLRAQAQDSVAGNLHRPAGLSREKGVDKSYVNDNVAQMPDLKKAYTERSKRFFENDFLLTMLNEKNTPPYDQGRSIKMRQKSKCIVKVSGQTLQKA
jgi:hypothetical protein